MRLQDKVTIITGAGGEQRVERSRIAVLSSGVERRPAVALPWAWLRSGRE